MRFEGDEVAEQIVCWVLATFGNQSLQIRDELHARCHCRLVDALHVLAASRVNGARERIRPLLEQQAILGRHTHHFRNDDDGQGKREIGNDIHRAARLRHIQQLGSDVGDARREPFDHARREGFVDERTQAGVMWRVAEQHAARGLVEHRLIFDLLLLLQWRASKTRIAQHRYTIGVTKQIPDARHTGERGHAPMHGFVRAVVVIGGIGITPQRGRQRVEWRQCGIRHGMVS